MDNNPDLLWGVRCGQPGWKLVRASHGPPGLSRVSWLDCPPPSCADQLVESSAGCPCTADVFSQGFPLSQTWERERITFTQFLSLFGKCNASPNTKVFTNLGLSSTLYTAHSIHSPWQIHSSTSAAMRSVFFRSSGSPDVHTHRKGPNPSEKMSLEEASDLVKYTFPLWNFVTSEKPSMVMIPKLSARFSGGTWKN